MQVQHLSVVDKDTVESTISDSLSERCECTFPREYIADGQFMCVNDDPNSVVYEGRLISTDDTDSVELLFHLQEWLLTEPTVSLSGVDLHATENCQVYIKELGNTDYNTQCDWLPNKVKECQHSVILDCSRCWWILITPVASNCHCHCNHLSLQEEVT